MGLPAGSPVPWGVGVGLANISKCMLGISSHPHPSRYELNCLGELAWLLAGAKEGSGNGGQKEGGGPGKEKSSWEEGLLTWKLPFQLDGWGKGRATVTGVQTLSTW